ncbi:PREDICTED: uncharacterized protein LOC107356341, partial [Acropora digitifera]|uniref:uncharacterized protein LOC107356341 n=1 Tax=Acropora digitifera TaxID=70779 RepID=UPI00077AB79A
IVLSFAVFNSEAETASDIPRHRKERSLLDVPKGSFSSTLDHLLGIKDDYDLDDDDDDVSDEGFFDEGDNEDDEEPDIMEDNFISSGSSSRGHKKNEIHVRNNQTSAHAQSLNSEDGLVANDDEGSGSGSASGSGDAEVIYPETFLSQQASEVGENNNDYDKAATADRNGSKVEDMDTENESTKDQENRDTEMSSPSKTVSKQPKNLMKLVVKGSREMLEQEEGSALQKDNNNEETSGYDSGSAMNVDAEEQAEKHVVLKLHSKNATNVKTNESENERVKENSTLHTEENDRRNNASQNTTKMENPKSQGKKMVNVELKVRNPDKQAKKLTEKNEPVAATKLSPQLLAHTKHAQEVSSHAKLAHKKLISPAAQPTCNSDSILAGHSLKGGTRSGRFTALGETASIHACLQRCCSKQTCDVALLIDGRCYGVACFSKELCKAVPVPHPHFIFSQLGFLNKGQKREKIQRNHEFHCQYGNLTLRNNENWSGELCGGVVRCKDGITTVTKCPDIPPKPDDCARPRLIVKHQKGKCCQMKWKCKAKHCFFNNRRIKHGYKLSDPLCTGLVSCNNGRLSMEYCPKIPERPKNCAKPKLKTISVPGKCCKKRWVCAGKLLMESEKKIWRCINPTLNVKRVLGECCEMSWTCEMS